jgi:hypothetical protein
MALIFEKLHKDNPDHVRHVQQRLRELYAKKLFTDKGKSIKTWKRIQKAAGLGDIAATTFRKFVSNLKQEGRLGGEHHAANFEKLVDYLRRENLLDQRSGPRRKSERRKPGGQSLDDFRLTSPVASPELIARAKGVYLFWRATTQRQNRFALGAIEIREENGALKTKELVRFSGRDEKENPYWGESEEIHEGIFFERAGVRVILSFAVKSQIPRVTYFVDRPDETSVGDQGWKRMRGVVLGVSKRNGRTFAAPCYYLRADNGEDLNSLRPKLDLVKRDAVPSEVIDDLVIEAPDVDFAPIIF